MEDLVGDTVGDVGRDRGFVRGPGGLSGSTAGYTGETYDRKGGECLVFSEDQFS